MILVMIGKTLKGVSVVIPNEDGSSGSAGSDVLGSKRFPSIP